MITESTARAYSPGPPDAAQVVEPEPVLRVTELVHRYGDRTVLDGLGFDVPRGQVFGLLGPNGAGKTTAFHVLTGLLAPVSGKVVLAGREVRPGDRALRRRMGVVFQGASLDPKLTATENLRLAAELHGIRGAEAQRRIDRVLAFADLEKRASEPVERFSGGMRRRIEIARALLHSPDLLVLDEPTSGLDQVSFDRTWARLHELCETEGLTVLVTTHRPEEAERCHRLGVLHGGRLVAVATPERLREQVSGDVVLLTGDAPEELAKEVSMRFGGHVTVSDGVVSVERERGHELIPRLVEAFPEGRIRTVSLRRPTLGDAFLKLTGAALHAARSGVAVEGE